MKITDMLTASKQMLSFEVFPPKTETVFESVSEAALKIATLHPSFISVTYGAGGGTSQYTLDLARRIRETTGVEAMAHLTCVSSTRETIHERIEEIHAAGISNVMTALPMLLLLKPKPKGLLPSMAPPTIRPATGTRVLSMNTKPDLGLTNSS